MLHALAILLLFQLTGEVAARALSLPVPGPVVGMVAMTAALALSARLTALIRPVATGILSHLSLLFVPAGVGVMGHLPAFGGHGWPIAVALVGSTVLAIAVGSLTFALVARATGAADGGGDQGGAPGASP